MCNPGNPAVQLSGRSLNALSDGASATESGSLFHGPTNRTAYAAYRRASCYRADGPWIDAHEGGLQQAHRKNLTEAGSHLIGT